MFRENFILLKLLKRTAKVLVAFMAMMAIAVMLFFWRVSNGPVELDGYSPFLRNILVDQGIGDSISFERSILTWRGAADNPTGRNSFEVMFLDVEIENPETSLKLNIPTAGMQFSTTALFRGLVAPTFVEFSGLELDFMLPSETWSGEPFDQDKFVATMRAYLDGFNNSEDLVPRLTKQLLAPPSALYATGYLQQVSLSKTAINITDELSGDVWQIPEAMLDIKKVEDGLSLLLEGEIDFEDENNIPLYASVNYNTQEEKVTSQIRVSEFVPKNVAGRVEGLSGLSTLDIPISGVIDFSLDSTFSLPTIDFEIDVREGMINPAQVYVDPIKIDAAMINGQFITSADKVLFDEFYLKFDGTEVTAEGTISSFRENPDILITANITDLPMLSLKTYWPPEFVKNARAWVETNITAGMIPQGELKFNITPDMWALEQLPEDAFTFNFDIVDAQSHYIKPMPQLNQVMAKASLKYNYFIVNVDSAKVENVDIKDAVLHFYDIAQKGASYAHFEIPINGRVEEILEIIDSKPFEFPSRYGIKQDSILGNAETILTLDFPLIQDIRAVDIDFDVQANVEGLNIPKLSESLTITEGTMELAVNGEGINSTGDIVLNGINFKAEWSEDFNKSAEYSTKYVLDGDVEGNEWNNLDLPFEPYVSGPAHGNLTLFGKGAGLEKGEGRFDLKNSRIEFEPLGWAKEKDDNATADFILNFEEDGHIAVNDISFNSDNLNGSFDLNYDGERTTRLMINSLKSSDHDFTGLFEWDNPNRLYQVSIKGDEFNAVPIMDIILNPVNGEDDADLPDFNLAGSIENVSMYNDVIMEETTVLAGYLGNEVVDFGYSGKWNDDRNLSILIASNDDATSPIQRLTLQTNDAGQALRALDFFTSGDQGDLLIEADMQKLEKGFSMEGTIEAEKFTIADSKVFSELLEAKEFAKAQEELEKNGLSFESFDSDFVQYDDVLTFTSGSAKGPTLGVTVDGFVDQKYNDISLGGTIIPAYGLNSLLSNIPLLGTILAGGKGEGVFAATYNMSGSVDDPDVNINPLMALAPGILRKIFGAIGGGNDTPTAREVDELDEQENAVEIPPSGN